MAKNTARNLALAEVATALTVRESPGGEVALQFALVYATLQLASEVEALRQTIAAIAAKK